MKEKSIVDIRRLEEALKGATPNRSGKLVKALVRRKEDLLHR